MTLDPIFQAPVNTTLKNMTIPVLFGMLLLLSFNIVDTWYVSLLGTQPLAAFSFTFPVTFTLVSLAIGMGIGTSAIVAKALGENDRQAARQHATISLGVSAVLIFSLAMLGLAWQQHIFFAMGATPANFSLIQRYMTPWLLGILVIIMPIIGNSIMRASGDTKTPAKLMGFGALLNTIFDPIFIFGLGPIPAMGITGAAIASILAGVFSGILVFYQVGFIHRLLGWGYHWRQINDSIVKVLTMSLPAAASNMMTPISASIVTALVASYGSEAVAAFGVGSRIESFVIIVVLALSMALPPFISQNFGAGNTQRVKQAYYLSIRFVLIWQAVLYVLLFICARWIADLFAHDEKVAEIIVLYLMVIPLSHGFSGITILTNSSLNALHQPMFAFALNLIRLFVLMLPCAYIGGYFYNINGLLIGVSLSVMVTGGISLMVMKYNLNKWLGHSNTQAHALNNNTE